jgi:beta-N-acetylglucosaminidase
LKSGEIMSNKINLNSKIVSSFEGPSQSYYTAKNRFDEILRTKLNVTSTSGSVSTGSSVYNAGAATTVNAIYDDVRLSSGANAADIDARLAGTGLEGLGASFVDAEKKYNVNAWFLAGLAIHESGYGSSKIATEKNNVFGFQAYDASPYASARTFNTKAEGVDTVAKYISENYLTAGGKYYNGVSIDGIGKRYATDPNWSTAIKKHMANLLLT